jgi:putative copper resistance protein D
MVDGVSTTLKASSFIAILLAAGIAIFLSAFRSLIDAAENDWLRKTALWSAIGALALVSLHFSFEAARMGGTVISIADSSLQRIALGSSSGTALLWKLAGLVLIGVGLFPTARTGRHISLLGAGVVLGGFTQTGHTSGGPWHPLLGSLLWIHLTILAFWFGALIPLFRASRSGDRQAAALVEAFSRIAIWLVPCVFLAGLGLAAVLIGSIRGIFTPYGSVIVLKALIFGVLLLLAASNRWRLGPGAAGGNAAAAVGLQRSIAAEFLLISATLALTAALTTYLSPES